MLSFRDPLLRRNDGVSFAPDGSQSIRGLIFLADKVDTVKRGKSVSGKKARKKSASRSAQVLLSKHASRGSRNSYCTIRFLAGLANHGLNTRNSKVLKRGS